MTTGSRLRDVLALTLATNPSPDSRWQQAMEHEADVFLATPEMQAIKQLIRIEVWQRREVRAMLAAARSEPVTGADTDPLIFGDMDGFEHTIDTHVVEWALS